MSEISLKVFIKKAVRVRMLEAKTRQIAHERCV